MRANDTAHGAEVERLARPLVTEEWVQGLVIGLIDGDSIEFYGFGRRAQDSGAPPGPDTVFEIGSVSKVLTALLLAEQVQQGLVAFDQPVASLLPPGVRVPGIEGFPITLEHLASHTAGLETIPTNLDKHDLSDPYADYAAEDLYAYLGSITSDATPGSEYSYSNLGMGLLGHLLARRAGTSFESLVIARIAAPLGMTRTAITVSEIMRADRAQGHDAEGTPVSDWHFDVLAGAGALRSTARDLVAFLRANLHPPPGPLGAAIRDSHRPRARAPVGHIALGWHQGLDTMPEVLWHNGQTNGFHAFVAFSPAHDAGVVVLANTATMVVGNLGIALLQMLRGEPYALVLPRLAHLSPSVLARYAGTYEIAPDARFTITVDRGRLMARLAQQPTFRIYPESETEFYYRIVDARITFVVDDDGQVLGLVLHQGGLTLPAKKIR
jgi:serine-type D-Ala-D-Ala carboxypeptidase/endopeptidase